ELTKEAGVGRERGQHALEAHALLHPVQPSAEREERLGHATHAEPPHDLVGPEQARVRLAHPGASSRGAQSQPIDHIRPPRVTRSPPHPGGLVAMLAACPWTTPAPRADRARTPRARPPCPKA